MRNSVGSTQSRFPQSPSKEIYGRLRTTRASHLKGQRTAKRPKKATHPPKLGSAILNKAATTHSAHYKFASRKYYVLGGYDVLFRVIRSAPLLIAS